MANAQTSKKTIESNKYANSSNSDLHVGQSVVLMDANLRGRILQLGRRIKVELEDGLVIETTPGEVAPTQPAELASLEAAAVQQKASEKKRSTTTGQSSTRTNSGHRPTSFSVDLHIEAIPGGQKVPKGQQLQFQLNYFRKILREQLPHKGSRITFIHGVGDGILKSAIRQELDEVFALRCSYTVGDPAVTLVTIR